MFGYVIAAKLQILTVSVRCTHNLNIFLNRELGLSRKALNDLRAKYPSLEHCSLESCRETVDLLRTKFQFTDTEIRSNAKLLTTRPFALLHYHHYLTEAGFRIIKPYDVLHFGTITNKSVSQLKKSKVIEMNLDAVEQFRKHVPVQYRDFSIDHETRQDLESLALSQVSELVLVKSLSKACVTSESEVQKRINLYPRLRRKSLQIVYEVVDFLLTKCRLLRSDVLKHIYLLNYDHRAMQTVIETFDEINGLPILDFVRNDPYLLTVPAPKIQKVLKLLSTQRLDNHLPQKNLYYLSAEVILHRLEIINAVPELSVYKESRQILKLVNNFNKAMFRLKCVEEKRLPVPGVQKLVMSDFHFKKYLVDGVDWSRQRDILEFLSRELHLPPDKLMSFDANASDFIPVNGNSNWKHTSLLTVQENLNYFRSLKYSITDLQKYPVILFYPTQKLKFTINQISEMHPNMSKIQTLYTTHYLIEKEYHFSGILMRNSNYIDSCKDD